LIRSSLIRDDLGRKRCSKGDECVHPRGPWLPEGEFARRSAAADGLRWYCKACGQQYKATYEKKRWKNCLVCGEPARTRFGNHCTDCEKQAINNHRRTQGGYICTWSPEPEWRGGWFSLTDMRFMLKDGSWPEGSKFDHMRRGEVLEVVRVVGPQMIEQRLENVEADC